MTLRHRCALDGCYKEALPDWAILDGCFPRGISPSDVDGIVEMNQHVLMLEWKPPLAVLGTGQRLLFLNMTRGSPLVQVLVIYGALGLPVEIELYQRGERKFRQSCDLAFLRWFCKQWGVFADAKPPREQSLAAFERRWGQRRRLSGGLPLQLRLSPDMRRLPDRRGFALRVTSAAVNKSAN